MSRSQNELGLSLVFLDGEEDHLLFVSSLPIIKKNEYVIDKNVDLNSK